MTYPTQVQGGPSSESSNVQDLGSQLESMLKEVSVCREGASFSERVKAFSFKLENLRIFLKIALRNPNFEGKERLRFLLVYNGLPKDWPSDTNIDHKKLLEQAQNSLESFTHKYQASFNLPDNFLKDASLWQDWWKSLHTGIQCVFENV